MGRIAEDTVHRILVALTAPQKVLERSNAEGPVAGACLVQNKVDSLKAVGLVGRLEGDLVVGSHWVASAQGREIVADGAEVVDRMIGDGAWDIAAVGSAVVETSRTREEPRNRVLL